MLKMLKDVHKDKPTYSLRLLCSSDMKDNDEQPSGLLQFLLFVRFFAMCRG